MNYYSTNHNTPDVTLELAVTQGLAADRGLFMPERIDPLPESFFREIGSMSFQELSFEVAKKFFGEDIPEYTLQKIVFNTLTFDTPLVEVNENIYSLELFHGPTSAFKDVGARFMARLLSHFLGKEKNMVHVLVATSGDTGSAVANGFLGVAGIKVHVLYPKGKVSDIQEKQFTTLGQNITALEIDGTFDDCQALVKFAFMDDELKKKITITSANSINVARFLPQAFYYFNAWAKLEDKSRDVVFSVPSGNFVCLHDFCRAERKHEKIGKHREIKFIELQPLHQLIQFPGIIADLRDAKPGPCGDLFAQLVILACKLGLACFERRYADTGKKLRGRKLLWPAHVLVFKPLVHFIHQLQHMHRVKIKHGPRCPAKAFIGWVIAGDQKQVVCLAALKAVEHAFNGVAVFVAAGKMHQGLHARALQFSTEQVNGKGRVAAGIVGNADSVNLAA